VAPELKVARFFRGRCPLEPAGPVYQGQLAFPGRFRGPVLPADPRWGVWGGGGCSPTRGGDLTFSKAS